MQYDDAITNLKDIETVIQSTEARPDSSEKMT